MTINKFTKPVVRELATEALDALQAVAKKHNLTIMNKGGTFDAADATLRIKFIVNEKATGVVSREQTVYELEREYNGKLPKFGATIDIDGEHYVITGWNRRARKYPITCRRVRDDRGYKFPVNTIAHAAVV